MAKQVKKTRKKRENKSKGLGDSVEKFTKATGIKKVVDKVSEATGIDCGCDERKKLLNKWFPYRNKECLNDEEFKWLDNYYKEKKSTVSYEEQVKLIEIHNRVLGSTRKPSSCGSCVRDLVNVMKRLYLEYKK